MTLGVAQAEPVIVPVAYEDLPGWQGDDHAAALAAFRRTCKPGRSSDYVTDEDWDGVCAALDYAFDPKAFFEATFQPVLMTDGNDPLITGYYEPELRASRSFSPRFRYPLYRPPPELASAPKPWLTRGEIEGGALEGRGLEIAWLEDPVESFFLHIQGSGRLRLTDGSVLRVGYAGRNGHQYRSVGKRIAELGIMSVHKVSAGNIKRWVRDNPGTGEEMLNYNRSYIFFREVEGLRPEDGPKGALNLPITAGRTVAIDNRFTPLGVPVWLETQTRDGDFARLMIAQDVGSAIKGAQRADIFFGSGVEAGRIAGTQRYPGRLVTLLPRRAAARLFAQE
ncbi:MAG: MltA domain-containing protein [Pseudomonadota bacterium]